MRYLIQAWLTTKRRIICIPGIFTVTVTMTTAFGTLI
jgi:hypothetical protein